MIPKIINSDFKLQFEVELQHVFWFLEKYFFLQSAVGLSRSKICKVIFFRETGIFVKFSTSRSIFGPFSRKISVWKHNLSREKSVSSALDVFSQKVVIFTKFSTFHSTFLEKNLTDSRSKTSSEVSKRSSFLWNPFYCHDMIFDFQLPYWPFFRSSFNFFIIWISMEKPRCYSTDKITKTKLFLVVFLVLKSCTKWYISSL